MDFCVVRSLIHLKAGDKTLHLVSGPHSFCTKRLIYGFGEKLWIQDFIHIKSPFIKSECGLSQAMEFVSVRPRFQMTFKLIEISASQASIYSIQTKECQDEIIGTLH